MKKFSMIMVSLVLMATLMFVSCSGSSEGYSLESLATVLSNYETIGDFHDGLAMVTKEGKIGYINRYGEEKIPCKYELCYNPNFSEGFAVAHKDVYYGYIDISGKEITKFLYSEAAEFKDGLACIEKGGKKGYIDNSGKEIISPTYDYALDFSEGIAAVCKNGKWGFVDKTGKETIPFNYEAANSFADGLAPVQKDGKWGYIDTSGKIIIPFQYGMADSFINGYAKVYTESNCLIDKSGKIIADGFDVINLCQGGLAIVCKNAQFGLINKGEELIPCKYRVIKSISEGLFLVYDDKENLIIDKTGKTICQYGYDESYGDQYTLSEGLLPVSKNEKYGFIDMTWKEVIPCVYEEVHSFSEGLAVVKKNGFYGYVDKNGSSTFDFQKNEINSEEVVKKRLNEIVEFAMKNSDDEGQVIENYFSNEFRGLYKRMIECENKNPDSEGLWYSGDFWSGSSEDSPSTMTAGNVNEINENKAVVDLIMGTGDGQKHIESVSLVFEKGNWFIDDIRGHKNELKEEVEACEDYIKNMPDDSWLQGHWVYEQGNYKGHFIIEGNTITQYSSMNPKPDKATFRIEDGAIRARLIDGMDLVVQIDYANHRIDYGEGNWMHKTTSESNDYSTESTNSSSQSRTFANEQYVTMYLANQTFRNSSGVDIRIDGSLRMYIDGDYAGVISVLRYNATSALLRFGGGAYGEGKIGVRIEDGRLQLRDPIDGTTWYQK